MKTMQRSQGKRRLMLLDPLEEDAAEAPPEEPPPRPQLTWFSQAKKLLLPFNSQHKGDDSSEEETEEEPPPPPGSEVERIVQRLERRNAARTPVPAEVKGRFLRLCEEARRERRRRTSDATDRGEDRDASAEDEHSAAVPRIRRDDVLRLRQAVRLEVEGRRRRRRLADGVKTRLGFRCHGKVLLQVLNRALDTIDETGGLAPAETWTRRQEGNRGEASRRRGASEEMHGSESQATGNLINSDIGKNHAGLSRHSKKGCLGDLGKNDNEKHHARMSRRFSSNLNSICELGSRSNLGDGDTEKCQSGLWRHISSSSVDILCEEGRLGDADDPGDEEPWFYYKDFAFYCLKVESNYPWMRHAGYFSVLTSCAFYFFTPVFWCALVRDPHICPRDAAGRPNWLAALFFASATMSTVGYGDVTVFTSGGGSAASSAPEPDAGRVFLAILFLILSLVVSVVGFQAGLDSHFSPFRRRLDVFGRRVYEILKEAHVVGRSQDKLDDVASRMRWSKVSQLSEICLVFLLLNLVGAAAVQLSLFGETENEFGEKLSISWMTSFYWAVQTTTTVGYGDVVTPESLRWFSLLYLAISTYFVG